MAGRKFNNGRLGEQLMNNDLFLAYNRIKYIGNGPKTPVQEYQSTIPDYSLWIDRSTDSDVMKVYDEMSGLWKPLFEGYYHPADLLEQPMTPNDGQLFIDSTGVIRYWQDNQWKVASAATATNLSSALAGVSNFLILPDMKIVSGSARDYLVPHVEAGKLFNNQSYVSRSEFRGNEIQMQYPLTGELDKDATVSWVHVNPSFLYSTRKRLIKVIDKETYFINVTTNNTEFYGFKEGEPLGTLLLDRGNIEEDTVSDYRRVSGGIQLVNGGRDYDFIYAITYNFDAVDNTFGSCIKGTVTIGDENEVFVGQLSGYPLVFLDGTYIEQEDYEYDSLEGMLSIKSDSKITNDSDLVVAAFANLIMSEEDDEPFEFEVTEDDMEGDDIVKEHEYIKQAKDFKHAVVFVQGVQGTVITDEVILDADAGKVTIKNFGPIDESGSLLVCIADLGEAYMSHGDVTFEDDEYIIKDDGIQAGSKYLIFVDGVCTSPSDHEVFDGYVKIDKMLYGGDSKYVLMSLDKGDEGIDLMFDSAISYFTFQVQDNNEGVVYNDCKMVVSYAYNDTENGILIDKNHIESAITNEQSYSTGEILKVKDTDNSDVFNYEYKIYNAYGDYTWTDYDDTYSVAERNALDKMITQFMGPGSVSIMNNESLKGMTLEYYAYTYCDETDEPILYGSRNCKIAAEGHMSDAEIAEVQDFKVDRTQLYSPPGKGILGAYVNGIQVNAADSFSLSRYTQDCKFSIDTAENMSFMKDWGSHKENPIDLYNLLKAIDENTTLANLIEMKSGDFVEELKDYSITIELLESLKSLAAALKQAETKNELFYYIEKLEAGETYSVNRDWLNHGNRFDNFDNSYTAVNYIGPGLVDVYLNGVMLDKSSYSMFNNNSVMLNDLDVAGGSDEYNRDNEETYRLIKYYIEEYNKETGETNGEVYKVYCQTPDEILVEYRPDVTLRKASYEIKESSYDMNGVFSYEDYEFPASLLNTKDEIKIWIDGILYTGGYYIEGKDIILKNSPLRLDPIKEYFNANPDTYKEWKKYNGEYSYSRSRIIFEWR